MAGRGAPCIILLPGNDNVVTPPWGLACPRKMSQQNKNRAVVSVYSHWKDRQQHNAATFTDDRGIDDPTTSPCVVQNTLMSPHSHLACTVTAKQPADTVTK